MRHPNRPMAVPRAQDATDAECPPPGSAGRAYHGAAGPPDGNARGRTGGRPVAPAWDPLLGDAISAGGRAVSEEQVLESLLADLAHPA